MIERLVGGLVVAGFGFYDLYLAVRMWVRWWWSFDANEAAYHDIRRATEE